MFRRFYVLKVLCSEFPFFLLIKIFSTIVITRHVIRVKNIHYNEIDEIKISITY